MSERGSNRREFLQTVSALGFGALVAGASRAWAVDRIDNPLALYPNRDWEQAYRDLWKIDSTFTFTCAPNDTHNCILNAHVKNGVMVRLGPTFGYGKAEDLQGNRASHRWDPRLCQKGLALTRKIYGDRRVRYPMVRKGWKTWVDSGCPRDADGRPPAELMRRGLDDWEKVSWDDAATMVAKAMINISDTYRGDEGKRRLLAQHYMPEMVDAMKGAGTQVMKFRGGMPLLGMTRVFGLYRMANSMALLDAKQRGVGPDQALGGRGFDNYSWHTDLPPGHTMVSGSQTVEFDLYAVEHAKLVLVWGMNWITTKMPDAHWLTEARLKGTKVVVIACEYSATANKADEAIVVRPGTTPALALGLAQVIVRDKLYDRGFVQRFTDLPLLLRTDTLELLRAKDVFPGHVSSTLDNFTRVLKPDEKPPAPGLQNEQLIPPALREEWGDYVVWDQKTGKPTALSRDLVGAHFDKAGLDPALEGEHTITLLDGKQVKVRPVFDVVAEYLTTNFTPEATEGMTWAPRAAVESLAKDIAANPKQTLFALGMGPNQFFNNDLKDRAVFLLAALTSNIGFVGGNVGSYAGNYRVALFNGAPQYINENPFDLELDPTKPARPKQFWRAESAHYYNHEDHALKVGTRMHTGKTHMPVPTKSMWFANANSILGNVKWHYNVVNNVLPKMDMVAVNEWWWSGSCEYADIVFAVDSWAELKHPDLTASVTNPFLTIFPATPMQRIHDTLGDIEVYALVGQKMAELTGDRRFADTWKFVDTKQTAVYIQRILDASSDARGFQAKDLIAKAEAGIPALLMTRTSPKIGGHEQTIESKPWYTKSGRLEFYRDEPEFIRAGENLPVYREPIDSTFYEPNVIVGEPMFALSPERPEQCGMDPDDLSCEARQARNIIKPWRLLAKTQHPKMKDGYKFVFHTPKYRHGAHTTPIDVDVISVLFGPFGDITRHDKRMPWVAEGYVDINPDDARELGVEDGDYVWIDADPEDRPYRGFKEGDAAYKVARLMARARYYPGTPRGVTRMWFNMYGASPGSVKGHEERPDGLARNGKTNYQSMFRYGSHQSATRGWLKPTLMTDTLVRKELFGQTIGKGFLPDSHCPTGAPRESIVKITKAEPGGIAGEGATWRPHRLGLRVGSESDALKRYLDGGFVKGRK